MPKKLQKRIEASWAGVFYREYFCRIDESIFEVLYRDKASRPNVPVNVLLGLETLKAGFGWSDEEMYEALSFNMQVRYALGYQDLSEGHFELRTVYNFRDKLRKHMERTGEDLVEQAFEQITDEQVEALELKTGKLRMDSTQVANPADEPAATAGGSGAAYGAQSERDRPGTLCRIVGTVHEGDIGTIRVSNQA